MKQLFFRISLKIISSLCKMKSKVTIGVKNTSHYTHFLYILLMVMKIFSKIIFVSSVMITTTIQILFIKYKQSLLITSKKTFQLWIRSSISLIAMLNNIRIIKTLLICAIVSKISIYMLNGYSLQLVMASRHAIVSGDLLNVMFWNIVYKDPTWPNFELPINMCKRNSFHHIFWCKSGRNGQCSCLPGGLLCKVKDHALNKE